MVLPKRNLFFYRLRWECIRRAKHVKVVWQDDVASDNPKRGGLPSFQKKCGGAIVRKQRTPFLCADSQQDNDRARTRFDRREMSGSFSVRMIWGRETTRRRRAPPSIWIAHPAFESPASSIRTRLSRYGKRIVNVRPLPSLLSSAISPPCSRTIRRTINRPRPEPVLFVVK
jgi:hypothetical protein